MEATRPAKLLRIHFAEHDRYEGQPLYEAVVRKCREMSMAGATVFRGLEGYGDSAEIHRAHLVRHDQPIVVTIVDSDAKIRQLLPVLEEMMDTGVMAISDAEVLRLHRTSAE
jgi:PII-like signaling protein